MSFTISAPPLPSSPYPGIKSFRYLDQQIFTAREDETWNLLRNLLIYRAVLLYGDSSSGKSSLVNAGLIPAALKENFIAHRLRIQPQLNKEIKIERISIEVEDQPPFLPSVLVDENSNENTLLNHEISLDRFYENLKAFNPEPHKPRPLLIFDQFEEFITLFEEKMRVSSTNPTTTNEGLASQDRVLKVLSKLIVDPSLAVKILFVFREDYLAKLDPLFRSSPELLNQFVRLLPPRVDEAEKIIRAPFVSDELKEKFLKRWIAKNRAEISEELARTVAAQLQLRSDTGFINLSELQIVCWKLWESKDPDRYFAELNHDIQKVIEDYWAGVLRGLGDLYGPAIVLLGHMITASGTRNIVSEPDLKTREKELDLKQIDDALAALVDHKLVRREPRNKIYFYEIASEFLVDWIDQKKAARLAEIRAREIAIQQVQAAHLARVRLKESEWERRLLRSAGAMLALILILASGLSFYALYKRREAQTVTELLRTERDNSGNIVTLLNELTTGEASKRLEAVNNLKKMDLEGRLPPDLVPVIVAVTANDTDKEVGAAASYFFTIAAPNANNEVTTSILKLAEANPALSDVNLAPRVYIQVASDNQKSRATKIADELRKNKFTVPGFALVDARHAPSANELRYYTSPNHPTDSNAENLLGILNGTDSQKWKLSPLKESPKVRPGHFELWFARDTSVGKGSLELTFRDAEDNEILPPERFVVNLTSSRGFKMHRRNEITIQVPPGTYSLTITVPGDNPSHDPTIEILEGEVTKIIVILHVP